MLIIIVVGKPKLHLNDNERDSCFGALVNFVAKLDNIGDKIIWQKYAIFNKFYDVCISKLSVLHLLYLSFCTNRNVSIYFMCQGEWKQCTNQLLIYFFSNIIKIDMIAPGNSKHLLCQGLSLFYAPTVWQCNLKLFTFKAE